MVEAVLDFDPRAAHHLIANGGMKGRDCVAYPVHRACANERCPGSVVQLLAKSNPAALRNLRTVEDNAIRFTRHRIAGIPLLYYLQRKSNIDRAAAGCIDDQRGWCQIMFSHS